MKKLAKGELLVDRSTSTDVKLSIKSGLMGNNEISKDEINVSIIVDSYSRDILEKQINIFRGG
mgnify:CR=1 FL=1